MSIPAPRVVSVLCLVASVIGSGCASTPSSPAGMSAGRFVAFDCDGQGFQARYSPDTKTIRIRSQHGAAELTEQGAGTYTGDGFKLMTQNADGTALEHDGKRIGKNCKPAG